MIDGSSMAADLQLQRETLPSLLDQVGILTARAKPDKQPIRLIHHFACTGGTLFSKCLASMPNVQLLSEVAPYSRMQSSSASAFAPTDLIRLLRASSQGSRPSLEREIFTRGVKAVSEDCARAGLRLVIREHCHSKYCCGREMLEASGLASILADEFSVCSLVTVRHPLDSFLSLIEHGWVNFTPGDLREYSKRYIQFIDDHAGASIFRYEDFVDDPDASMRKICDYLDMAFAPGFEEVFPVHRLSGDSGRSSAVIGRRARRAAPPCVAEHVREPDYLQLCERLGYETERGAVDD